MAGGSRRKFRRLAGQVARGGDEPTNSTVVVVTGELGSSGGGPQVDYVNGLRKFASYAVSVQCFTSTGSGPETVPIIVQTLEDGRLCIFLLQNFTSP